DGGVNRDGQQHGAAGEQQLAGFQPGQQQEQQFHAVGFCGFGVRRRKRRSAAAAPTTASTPILANFSTKAVPSAIRPSFFSATTPISAARPYSATWSV